MFKLNVTQRDIDNGVPWKIRHCALALAAKHHWLSKILKLESVGVRGVHFRLGKRRVVGFGLPSEAYAFMREFDEHRPVLPATFKLGKLTIERIQ